jgi:hypothetical protein
VDLLPIPYVACRARLAPQSSVHKDEPNQRYEVGDIGDRSNDSALLLSYPGWSPMMKTAG